MLKHLLMWALLCSTATVVCAQTDDAHDITLCDTAEYVLPLRLLEEVVVKAPTTVGQADRRVVRPKKETLRASTDGFDLLRKLRLPHVAVSPLTNTVTVAGGGNVMLCVNGIEATPEQVAAVRPQDVVRVEYHDHPGVRYPDAAAVVDFITARDGSGGSLSLDAFGAFAAGRWASIDHLAGQYNRGCSQWSVNVGYMGQRKDGWIRDYSEVWHTPDAALVRQERGLPVSVGGSGLEGLVNYNRLLPGGDIVNVRIGLDLNAVPNQEEGDRRAWLSTSEQDDPALVEEHTEEHSARPHAGVYYLHRIGGGRSLTFDAQAAQMRSRMCHEYAEDGMGEQSRVEGRKNTVRLLGMYESRVGRQVWRAGLYANGSFVSNTYLQTQAAHVNVRQSEAALMGEYASSFGPFSVVANLRVAHRHLSQAGRSIGRVVVLPSASVLFRPSDGWWVRGSFTPDCKMPAAAEVSNVAQPIQTGMVRRGNPDLKPFGTADLQLTAARESHPVSVEARIDYRREHRPVMESVAFEEGIFVRTYLNQRSFQRLLTGLSVTVRPWGDRLTLAAEPLLTHYVSHGNDYLHRHTMFRLGLSADFSYGNWRIYGHTISGPANGMYGEEIIEEKDMNTLMAGYKRGTWAIELGVFNAFMGSYWMQTRNLSALAPYTSKAHSGHGCSYVALKVSLSLHSGRKGRDVEVPEAEADNDSGILTGTK